MYLIRMYEYLNFESSNKQHIMMNLENLKKLLPGIVTRVAINYPIAYINSISFIVKNKMVAACFWNEKKHDELKQFALLSDIDHTSGCFIFNAIDDVRGGDIEITGTDETGNDFLVSLPYHHLIQYRIAS